MILPWLDVYAQKREGFKWETSLEAAILKIEI